MSDYSKTTNFASKDALLSGNPSKVVNGTELNTEFDDISVAIATKIEGASPTFTGTVTTATLATTIDDANNAAVITPFTLTHTTSGTPGAGIGVGLNFVAETASANNEVGASIRAVTTDVGAGTEDFDLVVNLMKAGAAASEALRVSSTGVLTTTGSVVSDTDSTDDLGTTGVRWANAYVDDLDVTTNIVVGGTVDGRDIATDGTKLDTVETSADVTDATNVNAAGAVMNTDATTAAMSFVIDEDAMGSNLATKVPTQQSTKAYVDAQLIAANGLAGALLVGASTGGTDVVVTAGDEITTNTIAETTAASGVTVDGLLIKDGTAALSSALKSATTSVDVAAATAPTAGQVLQATGTTAATWQTKSVTAAQISDVTSTAAELNILDGVTSTAAELNILDGVTATATELNLIDGVTATTVELNYIDGVTSAIQPQLALKDALPIIKGATYTAVAGERIITSAGGFTITLPATPTAGDTVGIKDGTGAAATTSFTVARNGSNIASSATDLTFDQNWKEITMTYVDATIGWSV